MPKAKTIFSCGACGYETPRWVGRCPGCGAWNTLEESIVSVPEKTGGKIAANQRPGTGAQALPLKDIPEDTALRSSTGISELDRVLGGGIVEGGLILIGGDPGIGKSTLLLQACDHLARAGKRVMYISGEESARQIKLRARRLGVESNLYVLAENALDAVEEKIRDIQPDVAVVDSIQTMYRPEMTSAPGSVSNTGEWVTIKNCEFSFALSAIFRSRVIWRWGDKAASGSSRKKSPSDLKYSFTIVRKLSPWDFLCRFRGTPPGIFPYSSSFVATL